MPHVDHAESTAELIEYLWRQSALAPSPGRSRRIDDALDALIERGYLETH